MTAPVKGQAAERRPVIDVASIPCPCCGDLPWCPGEVARAAADAARAPEVLVGSAMYGGWPR